jgi:Ca2+-binding RTX toxin-like protein
MMGENGDDYISGADGVDTIIGGDGSDRMLGGTGDDYFYAQDGIADNGIFGNAGTDTSFMDLQDTNWTSLERKHYPA